MFESLTRSWDIAKACLNVLRKDKEILLFPLISGIILIVIAFTFISPYLFSYLFYGNIPDYLLHPALIIVLILLFYIMMYFIIIFFNSAIVGCATIRLQGENPQIKDGIRIASENKWLIFQWAILSAIIGLILQILQNVARQKGGWLAEWIVKLIGIAWSFAVFLVIPVIIYEKLTPFKAISRSVSLIKKTWKETAMTYFGMDIIFGILGVIGFLIILFLGVYIGIALNSIVIIIAGLIIAVIYFIFIAILSTALKGILCAILYRYATTGKISEDFPQEYVKNPW